MCKKIQTYCIECNIDYDIIDIISIDKENSLFSDIEYVEGCPICLNELWELNFAIRKFILNRKNIIDSTYKEYYQLINENSNI